ncbi:hypothetical protein LEN26_000368 [Aphanomyces euteiches]|nr:hypothetical protein AeMF1_002915 [Aphanomyces euteiches]KAH9163704.1 hypothetical protein LEN26_000368 [Aphanomyces euteiches]KAH9190526.1 hypothetical protein AeNC1_007497 [Aphanomyces euteiches]
MNPQQPQETIPGRLDVQCDGCGLFPFVGAIYASTRNSNFFLCTQCAQTGKWSQSQGPFNIITADIPAPIRSNSVCDGCSRSIDGVGFTSAKVFNFDLCLGCHATGKWIDSHGPFVKQPFLSPNIRYDAQCDGCQLFPFLGTLYFSSRVPSFCLCEGCHNSQRWTQSHGPFEIAPAPTSHVVLDSVCDGCKGILQGVGYISSRVFNFHLCLACKKAGTGATTHGPFLPMVFELHQQQQQQQLQTYSKGTCQGCHAEMYVMAWRNVAGFRICGDCMLSGKYDLLQGPFYELASWHAMTMI